MNLLDAALDYAARGLAVFPLHPGTKAPATANGVHSASTDPERIRAWWAPQPDRGIGLATGDGLFVVDVDAKAGFDASGAARLALDLPETYTVATRNGGWHLYFEGDGPSTVGRLLPGVDTRGAGGYVVAPPTPGYEVLWNESVAQLPEGLLLRLSSRPAPSEGRPLLDPVEVLQGIPEGRRNDTLFRYASRLRGLGLAEEEAVVLVTAALESMDLLSEASIWASNVSRVYATYPGPEEPEIAKYGPYTPIEEITSRPVDWLWFLRVPLGALTLIAGIQGKGKSYLTAALAADVSNGRQLPGGVGAKGQGAPTAFRDVLIGSYEDDAGKIKERLEKLGADLSRIGLFGFRREGSTIFNPAGAAELERVLEEHPHIRLVVLDPITSQLGGSVELNSNEQVREAMEPFASIAEKYQVAIVAVAHLNKASQSDLLSRVSGATAFTALARYVLAVGVTPDGRRLIQPIKHNWSGQADVVEFHIDDDGFRWGGRVSGSLEDLLKNKQ